MRVLHVSLRGVQSELPGAGKGFFASRTCNKGAVYAARKGRWVTIEEQVGKHVVQCLDFVFDLTGQGDKYVALNHKCQANAGIAYFRTEDKLPIVGNMIEVRVFGNEEVFINYGDTYEETPDPQVC